MDITKQIYGILEEIIEEISIEDDTLLLDEGILDSVSILYLVSELENKNNIKIDIEEITENNFKTVLSITELVKKKLGDK